MAELRMTTTVGLARSVAVDRCRVNGVDCWSLAKPDGVSVGPNPTDAETSGRSKGDAGMHRQIVAVKDKIVIKFRNLTPDEAQTVSAAVYQEFVTVDYVSPRYGARTGLQFYAQVNAPTLTTPMRIKGQWVPWSWSGLELTLVEK